MPPELEARGLENIVVRPVYIRAVNAIVQPELQVPCSLYFFQKWLPRLGALRWSLVLALRTICTQRQPDGTSRGEVTRTELAAALGVHEATITRLLNTVPSHVHHGWRVLHPQASDDLATAYLAKFIPRLRYKYQRDEAAGVTRRVGYIIDVVMDDPLIPEDEERLAVVLAEQVLQSLPASASVTEEIAPPHRPTMQSASAAADEEASSRPAATESLSPPRRVKAHLAPPHGGVKEQNTRNALALTTHDVLSPRSVKVHSALDATGTAQDSPTLTETSTYTYEGIRIDLTRTRKRDIRAAVAPLVEFAARALRDYHSKGMFYATAMQLYPAQLDVFGKALDIARREGLAGEGVNMGAVFVNAVRSLAAEKGVALRLGRERVADRDGEAINGMRGSAETDARWPLVGPALAAHRLWPYVLQELRSRTTRGNYEMWLRNCVVVGCDGDVVVLGAPSAFARDWISDRLLDVIEGALCDVLKRRVRARVVVAEGRMAQT